MLVQFTLGDYGSLKLERSIAKQLEAECGTVLTRHDSSYTKTTFDKDTEGNTTMDKQDIVPPDDDTHIYIDVSQKLTGDLERIQLLLPQGTAMRVEGMGDPKPLMDLMESMRRLESRIAGMALGAGASDTSAYLNPKVNVHVPSLGMMMVDDVMLENDCCTDHLKDQLEDGWRILAVCPQPDQRRPDYILGRHKAIAHA